MYDFIMYLLLPSKPKTVLCFIHNPALMNSEKKPGPITIVGISATRLSQRDPVGFPSHSREWFSIIVYRLFCTFLIANKRVYLCDLNHK
jgi:hypothetical protein